MPRPMFANRTARPAIIPPPYNPICVRPIATGQTQGGSPLVALGRT